MEEHDAGDGKEEDVKIRLRVEEEAILGEKESEGGRGLEGDDDVSFEFRPSRN